MKNSLHLIQSMFFIVTATLFVMGCGSDFKAKQNLLDSSIGNTTSDNNNNSNNNNDNNPVSSVSVVGSITTTQVVANGIDQSLVTIKIINEKSDPVSGVTPSLYLDGSFKIVSSCTVTNGLGESVCRITSTLAGTRSIHTVFPTEFQTNITFIAGPASKINILAGDNQTSAVSTAVMIVPQVQVLDTYDNPVPNVSVTFTPSAGGSVLNSSAKTDSSGKVGPGRWTLSSQAGANTLKAAVGSLSVTFNAMGLSTDPIRLVYFPVGSCQTGKLEVYVNGSPHPKYQYIDSEDCVEIQDSVAFGTLKVRCVDMTGAMLPSDFEGPAVDSRPKASTVCKVIHRA